MDAQGGCMGEYLVPTRREQFQIDRWMALHWKVEIEDRRIYFSAEELKASSPLTNPTSDFAARPMRVEQSRATYV